MDSLSSSGLIEWVPDSELHRRESIKENKKKDHKTKQHRKKSSKENKKEPIKTNEKEIKPKMRIKKVLNDIINLQSLTKEEEEELNKTQNRNKHNNSQELYKDNFLVTARPKRSASVEKTNPRKKILSAINNDDPNMIQSLSVNDLSNIYAGQDGNQFTLVSTCKSRKLNRLYKWIVDNYLFQLMEQDMPYSNISSLKNRMFLRGRDFNILANELKNKLFNNDNEEDAIQLLNYLNNNYMEVSIKLEILPLICLKQKPKLFDCYDLDIIFLSIENLDDEKIKLIYEFTIENSKLQYINYFIDTGVYPIDFSPLTYAIKYKKDDVVKLILTNEKYRMKSFEPYQNPFLFACSIDYPKVLECFSKELQNPKQLSDGFNISNTNNALNNKSFLIDEGISLLTTNSTNQSFLIVEFDKDFFKECINHIKTIPNNEIYIKIIYLIIMKHLQKEFLMILIENDFYIKQGFNISIEEKCWNFVSIFIENDVSIDQKQLQLILPKISLLSEISQRKINQRLEKFKEEEHNRERDKFYDALHQNKTNIIKNCISSHPEFLLSKITKHYKPINFTVKFQKIDCLIAILEVMKENLLSLDSNYFQIIIDGYNYSIKPIHNKNGANKIVISKLLFASIQYVYDIAKNNPMNFTAIMDILKSNEDIHIKQLIQDENPKSQFRIAIETCNINTITELLNSNPILINESFDNDNATPLFVAIMTKQQKIIELILNKNANVLQKCPFNKNWCPNAEFEKGTLISCLDLAKSINLNENPIKVIINFITQKAFQTIHDPKLFSICLEIYPDLYKSKLTRNGISLYHYVVKNNEINALSCFPLKTFERDQQFLFQPTNILLFAIDNSAFDCAKYLISKFPFLQPVVNPSTFCTYIDTIAQYIENLK